METISPQSQKPVSPEDGFGATEPAIDATKTSNKVAAPGSPKAGSDAPPRGVRRIVFILKNAGKEWFDAKAPRWGASLSYYAVFSLAPTLLIALYVAGLLIDTNTAQERMYAEISSLLGKDAAVMIKTMVAASSEREGGVWGAILGIGTLLFGATVVMIELEAALDALWKTQPRKTGIVALIRERILSLGLILAIGFLLVTSLILSAMLSFVTERLGGIFPGWVVLGNLVGIVVPFIVITVFFALVFKYLPNARVAWKDVWVGAVVTSLLFQIGRIAIGLYLGKAGLDSEFGAAGSLAVLLVWIYYSSQIVLFGASITHVWAQNYGSSIKPEAAA